MTSYGGLIPGQSVEDFFSCSSMPRNRELMRVFKDVGLVEQLGSGMSRILKAYSRDIYQISDHFIKVTFPFEDGITLEQPAEGTDHVRDVRDVRDNVRDENRSDAYGNQIRTVLRDDPKATAKALSESLGISVRQVGRIVKRMRENGAITRVGSDRKGSWKVN